MEIELNKKTTNEYEFEIKIKGLVEGDTPKVRFLIHQGDLTYMVKCKKIEENKFAVTVPVLEVLDHKKTPTFSIEILADSYYFEPCKGSIKIIEKEDIVPEVEEVKVVSKPGEVVDKVKTEKTVPEQVIAEQHGVTPKPISQSKLSAEEQQRRLKKVLSEVRIEKPIVLDENMSTEQIVEKLLAGTKFAPKVRPPLTAKPPVNSKVERRVKAVLENL